MNPPLKPRLRRKDAAAYLLNSHGIPIAIATLAKMASVGGGPSITYFGRVPLYALGDLDDWAAVKLGQPVASTSERKAG